jgi:hypothetical protein
VLEVNHPLFHPLFDCLEESDKVTAGDLEHALFGRRSLVRPKHMICEMDRLVREYEGDIDVEAGVERHGPTYVFDQMHRELASVKHERLSMNLDDLRVGKIVC